MVGGSIIRVENGKITDVGSRSAHIAGVPYEIFSEKLSEPEIEFIAPLKDDEKVYAVVKGADGRKVSLTLAGAANLLCSVPENDYAFSAEKAAKIAMDKASEKIWAIIIRLIAEYKLSTNFLTLAGGGGSGGVIVPYLGKKKNVDWKIVKNAPIISTIGVAMGATELKKNEITQKNFRRRIKGNRGSIIRFSCRKCFGSGICGQMAHIRRHLQEEIPYFQFGTSSSTRFRP